ncbi:hypothetical protein [Alicyclobacillus mengziensis]|uniref:Uncharacterized protein n=1 Tax=Alicyclobacillus mengziensis TaxID=2931921 RepID=A0A9X7VY65_9BACL|nr:hypothetical protein [Alicyclobacillus mengziensis]QSO47199.1 hypothetical protein JZ786_22850 [Alicyclobacillus mengziensis]
MIWKSLCIAGCLFVGVLNVPSVHADARDLSTIEFRVGTPNLKRVQHARIMVIAPDGNVVASGFTDPSGIWTAYLPNHPQDPRFKAVRKLGIATAIVLANGYNEEVVVDVPVDAHAVQPVILKPIQLGKRNEPHVSLGNLHHHDIQRMVDAYAQKFHLKKQPPISSERGDSPWSPDA